MHTSHNAQSVDHVQIELPTFFDGVTFEDIEAALHELLNIIQNSHSFDQPRTDLSTSI